MYDNSHEYRTDFWMGKLLISIQVTTYSVNLLIEVAIKTPYIMEGDDCMNNKLMKAIKIIVPVVSVGVTLATNYLADKNLEDKISKKVSEALTKSTTEES